MTTAVNINRIISGGASIPVAPGEERNFHNTCFIQNSVMVGDKRINYMSDLDAVINTYGSNSEAVKCAKTFYQGGFNGNSPREFYVATINTTTYALAAGDAVYNLDDNALVISGDMQARFSDTTYTFADFVINGENVSAYAKYTNDTDHKLKLYASKADAIEDKAIDLSVAPYSLADEDATTTATIFAEGFVDTLSEILKSSTVYHLILDNTFSKEQKETFISMVEASTTTHAGYVLDYSNEAIYQDKDTDESSILHYASNAKFTKTLLAVDDEDKKDEYKQASACSYYAQVNWTASSPMGTLAWKTMAGITPSDFANGGLVDTTAAYDNIQSKNGNCYTNFSDVNAPAWELGNAPNGNDFKLYIASDYAVYKTNYTIFFTIQSLPHLPVNQDGAIRLKQSISNAMDNLTNADVIGPGVAEDGEVFGVSGYNVIVPVPTGANKAKGVWTDIKITALIKNSTKKVEYMISFKQ